MILDVQNITVNYGLTEVLHGVSLKIGQGEVVSVIGHNGAGKSTLLKTISGLLNPIEGKVVWCGQSVGKWSANKMVRSGVSLVPEGRQIFGDSTVYENMEIGAYIRKDTTQIKKDIEKYMQRFPILYERRNQKAGLLSGGEQQMLAIVRALMSRPRLLLLDEPSLGLSPKALETIYNAIAEICEDGTSILLVEQNAKKALEVSDRTYVMVNGKMIFEGMSGHLTSAEVIQKAFM